MVLSNKRTEEIQQTRAEFGVRLGFDTDVEFRIKSDSYQPRIDVIWYLNLTKYFDLSFIE